jgi:HEAT repeat protein
MSLAEFMRRGKELGAARPAAPSPDVRRRVDEAALQSPSGEGRRRALLELHAIAPDEALEQARKRISDRELFAVAAGILLEPGTSATTDDLTRVAIGLDRLVLDEPTRIGVTSLLFQALVPAHPNEAAQLAARLLKSADPKTRYQTLGSLIALPTKLAVPLLMPSLHDPDPGVQQQARSSLAYLDRVGARARASAARRR